MIYFPSYFLIAGESGLGKSTLINSLFLTDLYSSEHHGPSHRVKKTVQVHLRSLFQCSCWCSLEPPVFPAYHSNGMPPRATCRYLQACEEGVGFFTAPGLKGLNSSS